ALLLPAADEDVDQGEFISAGEASITTRDGRNEYRQRVIVTVFDTGQIDLRLRVQYRLPGDTTLYSVFTSPISLQVSTVVLDTSGTFKDIRDVVHISLTVWDYLLLLAILVLILLMLWFGYRWYRKWKERPAPEIPQEAEPQIPAHVIALQALETLRARKLWQAGMHKQYQSEVTEILREYIERRHHIPALEQTSPEIISALAVHGISPELIEHLERILRIADMTKFATYQPSNMQHEDAMDVATSFVNATAVPHETSETMAGTDVRDQGETMKKNAGADQPTRAEDEAMDRQEREPLTGSGNTPRNAASQPDVDDSSGSNAPEEGGSDHV
ncbi:MAG: hypothetical protein KFH87_12945, partial [Bacteroidetes bacterium]|nr:hypothetical protein [Bacteroidota bacterium]